MGSLTSAELTILKTEIETDPLVLGYSLTDNALTTNILNTPRSAHQVPNDLLKTQDVLDLTDFTELTTAEQQRLYAILTGREEIQVTISVVDLVKEIFAAGTNSRTQLSTLQTRDGSRAEELIRQGIGITYSNVNEALTNG